MKIRKSDNVMVISGNDKGKTGKVLNVFPKVSRVIVEGINLRKRHTKPTQKNPQGGILEKESPIHVSNVMLIDSKTKLPINLRPKTCILHPKYKGIRKPRVNRMDTLANGCECWAIYMNNYPDKKYPDFISGVPRSLNDWRRMGKESAENLMKMLKEFGPMKDW